MKRSSLLIALMLLSSSAYAGNGISFSIAGHRIHVNSVRCRSFSCLSVSGQSRRDDGGDCHGSAKSPPPAPAMTGAIPEAPIATRPPESTKPAPVATPPVVAPPASPPPPPRVFSAPAPQPVVAAPPAPPRPAVMPPEPARPAPHVVRVSHETGDEPAEGPVGDWETETGNLVRIRLCGRALCGYTLDRATRDLGESVLINMKRKQDAQWSGSVYSHDSGNIYYGTIELKGIGTLRVEACALGRFYCTGTDWIRASRPPQHMITQRQQVEPRS
ncbi:DUF2147 domain-containing protein [Bradyrhizobium jicamae]|uniref:DUF2147 domain-containing protein n=1 Tax=Bradyrhizobium jicamae TaxID=280332 RepID=A0ABS5FE48_9BRAD|nr:DUF2147 domain-containing protein [Bradyrhizobium jicamae]MBR0795065.1 DUF2147 domain-containing protein [Bradyrhizobium jicamae]